MANASYFPSDGSSAPGSASLSVFDGTNIIAAVAQCVSGVSGNVGYGFGVDARLVTPAGNWQCWLSVTQYTASDCSGGPVGTSAGFFMAPTGSWSQFQSSHTTDPAAHSVQIQVACSSDAWPFTVLVDDVFYGPGLVPVELAGFTIE